MSEDAKALSFSVDFHQAELVKATDRLVHQTKVVAEEERIRQACVRDVAESRTNLDRALYALVTRAGKP